MVIQSFFRRVMIRSDVATTEARDSPVNNQCIRAVNEGMTLTQKNIGHPQIHAADIVALTSYVSEVDTLKHL